MFSAGPPPRIIGNPDRHRETTAIAKKDGYETQAVQVEALQAQMTVLQAQLNSPTHYGAGGLELPGTLVHEQS